MSDDIFSGRGDRVIFFIVAVQSDVLRLAAGGASTAEIAGQLCLTAGTVRNHISSIIIKSGARNRVDAIRIADRSGWL
jgi:two-component system response regulator DesR